MYLKSVSLRKYPSSISICIRVQADDYDLTTLDVFNLKFHILGHYPKCHLKHPQRSEDVDSLLRVGGQGFHLGVNCGEPKGVERGIFCSSFILVLR